MLLICHIICSKSPPKIAAKPCDSIYRPRRLTTWLCAGATGCTPTWPTRPWTAGCGPSRPRPGMNSLVKLIWFQSQFGVWLDLKLNYEQILHNWIPIRCQTDKTWPTNPLQEVRIPTQGLHQAAFHDQANTGRLAHNSSQLMNVSPKSWKIGNTIGRLPKTAR